MRSLTLEYDYASANGRGGLGTILVQGVGNHNIDAQYSGLNASRFTITVGGIQQDGFAYSLSNYGASLLVTAPRREHRHDRCPRESTSDTDGYVDAAENAAFPPDGLTARRLRRRSSPASSR